MTNNEDGVAAERESNAFGFYQGDEWFYSEGVEVTSYVLEEDDTVSQDVNYQRIETTGGVVDLTPEQALLPQQELGRGRAVRDGVLTSPLIEAP